MSTAQANLQKWSKDYAYKSEVKSWEIIPMKVKDEINEAVKIITPNI